MTTAQDLLFVTLDATGEGPVESGDLSLARAGAELVDLLGDGTVTLEGEVIVPGLAQAPADRLLADAASALVRQRPFERVEDWLWRRGEGLSAAYLTVMEEAGQVTRTRRRLLPGDPGSATPLDSPARRGAAERWASGEALLAGLAGTLGLVPGAEEPAEIGDDAAETVLAAVGEAVVELDGVRQRRRIEQAAFDNIWRGPAG
jgi:hypothetical protein